MLGWLHKLLSDPIWEGIAALVAIIAVLLIPEVRQWLKSIIWTYWFVFLTVCVSALSALAAAYIAVRMSKKYTHTHVEDKLAELKYRWDKFKEYDRRLERLEASLDFIQELVKSPELASVREKWPQLLQILAKSPANIMLAEILAHGTPISIKGGTIEVLFDSKLLKELLESLNAEERLAPLLEDVFGKPCRITSLSPAEQTRSRL